MKIKRYCMKHPDHFTISASGSNEEYIRKKVFENYEPLDCPVCGADVDEEVVSDE